MATNTLTLTAGIDNSPAGAGTVNGMHISRTVINLSGVDIAAIKPICNAGWNSSENCMSIRLPSSDTDIIIGITLNGVNNGCIKVIRYVSTGLITGVDTSAWNFNDMLYAVSDGTLTNNPEQEGVIPQEIGLVIHKDAVNGEIYVATVGTQVQYMKLAVSVLAAKDAPTGSGLSGNDFTLKGGKGDQAGSGGDVQFVPGMKGDSGTDGYINILQSGTVKAANKILRLWHDGVNAFLKALTGSIVALGKFIVRNVADTDGTKQAEIYHNGTNLVIDPKSGALTTNGKDIDVGNAEMRAGSQALTYENASGEEKIIHAWKWIAGVYELQLVQIHTGSTIKYVFRHINGGNPFDVLTFSYGKMTIEGLGSNKIVETDEYNFTVGATKKTAYNCDFGTSAGTACQGNDARLSDSRKCNNEFDSSAEARTALDVYSKGECDSKYDGIYGITETKEIAIGASMHTIVIENGKITSWTIS